MARSFSPSWEEVDTDENTVRIHCRVNFRKPFTGTEAKDLQEGQFNQAGSTDAGSIARTASAVLAKLVLVL